MTIEMRPATAAARGRGARTALVGQVIALAALYWLLGRVSLGLGHFHEDGMLLWQPTGFALAAMILSGRRLWPGVLLGSLILNWTTGTYGVVSVGIAVGNALEAYLGALLLDRLAHFRPTFERVKDVVAFVLIGVLGTTLVGPTVGVSVLANFGDAPIVDLSLVWVMWWFGDVGGAIVVTPLLLLCRYGSPDWRSLATRGEAWLLLACLVAASALSFGGLLPQDVALLASFFPFTFVVWAGARLGTRGAVLASGSVSLIAITGSSLEQGPFVVDEAYTSMMLIWCYALLMGSASLALASVIAQRDWAQQLYREGEQERLQIAQQINQAQRLESLGLLAGGIAHDFNNILTVILGNSMLLKEGLRSDPEAHEELDEIETASKLAAELCDQLLAYAGRERPHKSDVPLGKLVEETCSLVRTSIREHVAIEIPEFAQGPIIKGDATLLRQVVMNLVLNAAEAISGRIGTVRIEVAETVLGSEEVARLSGATQALPGRFAVLAVVDDGSGMDVETQGCIFDPFFTTKPKGRGLGLASVIGIVQSHGGGLGVESSSEWGTCFRVYLPLATEVAADGEVDPVQPLSMPGGLVLVADDEPKVRKLVIRILESNGYRTLSATDGHEALGRFYEHSAEIDAVLLDVTMPGRNGPETLREIRACDSRLPVLLMSGYRARESAGEAEPTAFLRKPFSNYDLLAQIGRAITNARSPAGEGLG